MRKNNWKFLNLRIHFPYIGVGLKMVFIFECDLMTYLLEIINHLIFRMTYLFIIIIIFYQG